MVCGIKKFDYVTPALKELKWLPVASELHLRNATLAFKCMTSCAPDYLSDQFVKRRGISQRTTRNSQKLNIPLSESATGQRTFLLQSCKLVELFGVKV